MNTEIEAKFLNVDFAKLRVTLKSLGGHLVSPERLMKRQNYDYADDRLDKINGWVRLRDEGDKITLSYKQVEDRGLHGTKEVNVTVDSFAAAHDFLLSIGLHAKSYQETKRESWKYKNSEIEIDTWPWAPPFIEIESPNEDEIREVSQALGLKWEEALHGSVEIVYQQYYDVTEAEIDFLDRITFSDIPDWLEAKRKPIAA